MTLISNGFRDRDSKIRIEPRNVDNYMRSADSDILENQRLKDEGYMIEPKK